MKEVLQGGGIGLSGAGPINESSLETAIEANYEEKMKNI